MLIQARLLAVTFLGALALSSPATAQLAREAYIKSSNVGVGDEFGSAVAIDGDTLVVSAPREDSIPGDPNVESESASGAAYVFVRSASGWTQQALLKASNAQRNDFFGRSVDVSGDIIVVGANGENSSATGVNGNEFNNSAFNSGAAYVFCRVGTTWSQEAYLKASNTQSHDAFGFDVAVSGDTILVSAMNEDSQATGINGNQQDDPQPGFASGAVYAFVRNGGQWAQQAYIKASNTGGGDRFGFTLDLDGNVAVIGAYGEDSDAVGVNGAQNNELASASGAAYVFRRVGTTWAQEAYLKASNTELFDFFGYQVAVQGDTVAVCAIFEDSGSAGVNGNQADNSQENSGAMYMFSRASGQWIQEAYLKTADPEPDDLFGFGLSVDGNRLSVGSLGGMTIGFRTGTAHVFERTGTVWSPGQEVLSANVDPEDGFWVTSLSGDTLVVGAHGESSNSIGVNGTQTNNAAPLSGAAYVYDLAPDHEPGISLCHGDGGDQMGCTDCPCMNNAPEGRVGGCLNSAGTSARLEGTGNPSVSLPANSTTDLRFELHGTVRLALCVLVSGNATAPESPANPCFGLDSGARSPAFDGLRCAILSVRRHGGRVADGNGDVGLATPGWGGEHGPPAGIAQAGGAFSPGQTRIFQVVHRDDPNLGCQRGLNTSQAVRIVFGP